MKHSYKITKLKESKFGKNWRISQCSDRFLKQLMKQALLKQHPSAKKITEITLKRSLRYYRNLVVLSRVNYINKAGKPKTKLLLAKSVKNADLKRVYTIQKKLYQNIKESPYIVNKPIQYLKKYNLIIFEALEGELLRQTFCSYDRKTMVDYNKKAINFLKVLHTLKIPAVLRSSTYYSMHKEIWYGRVLEAFGVYYHNDYKKQELIKSMVKNLIIVLKKFSLPELFTLVHSDYGPHNVIITPKEQFGVIDFTDFGVDDPAHDVASYIVQMAYIHMYWRCNHDIEFVEAQAKLMRRLYKRNNMSKNLDERIDGFICFYLLNVAYFYITCKPYQYESDVKHKGRIEYCVEQCDRILGRLMEKYDIIVG